ncbi:MAG: cyclic nucleotide-binding domain-containing protein [Betaproteobacteria bacterium]|nr:cyclic nucleotide-binding domain-containing protein [Betaproteobacteria bacterium]
MHVTHNSTANRTGSQSGATDLLLGSVPLFSMLTPEQRAILAPAVRRLACRKGETIIHAGEPTQSLFVIISGRVDVSVTNSEGKQVILAILRSGDYFGEMSLIDDEPRSADVVARGPCELLVLDRPEFRRCLEANFQLAMDITRRLVRRLRDADNRISSLALLDVYGRVAQLLLREAELVDGLWMLPGSLSRVDIARMIGASREMVTRVLKDLQQRGCIELRGTTIILHDTISGPR